MDQKSSKNIEIVDGQLEFLRIARLLLESQKLREESNAINERMVAVHEAIKQQLAHQGSEFPLGDASEQQSHEAKSGD